MLKNLNSILEIKDLQLDEAKPKSKPLSDLELIAQIDRLRKQIPSETNDTAKKFKEDQLARFEKMVPEREREFHQRMGADWWDTVKKLYQIKERDGSFVVTSDAKDWDKKWEYGTKLEALYQIEKLIKYKNNDRAHGHGDKDADFDRVEKVEKRRAAVKEGVGDFGGGKMTAAEKAAEYAARTKELSLMKRNLPKTPFLKKAVKSTEEKPKLDTKESLIKFALDKSLTEASSLDKKVEIDGKVYDAIYIDEWSQRELHNAAEQLGVNIKGFPHHAQKQIVKDTLALYLVPNLKMDGKLHKRYFTTRAWVKSHEANEAVTEAAKSKYVEDDMYAQADLRKLLKPHLEGYQDSVRDALDDQGEDAAYDEMEDCFKDFMSHVQRKSPDLIRKFKKSELEQWFNNEVNS